MHRITTASVAAATALTIVASPAIAADNTNLDQGSAVAFERCTKLMGGSFAETEEMKKKAKTEEERVAADKALDETLGEFASSTPTGTCIKVMTDERSGYRSNTLGFLIGVPLALVALLGAAAAFSGSIPGVSLPAIPGLPM